MTLDKKQLAEAQQDFELAVRLIMKQENVPQSKARFIAWLEGPEGLAKRMGQLSLPLK